MSLKSHSKKLKRNAVQESLPSDSVEQSDAQASEDPQKLPDSCEDPHVDQGNPLQPGLPASNSLSNVHSNVRSNLHSNPHSLAQVAPAPQTDGLAVSQSGPIPSGGPVLFGSAWSASQPLNVLDSLPPLVQPLLALIPDLVYVYDLVEQRLQLVNDRIAAVLGYSLAELNPLDRVVLAALIHAEDLGRMQAHLAQVLNQEGSEQEVEFRLRHGDGDWHWMRSRDRLLARTPDGRPWKLLGILTDISEQKQTAAALQQKVLAEQHQVWISRQTADFAQLLRQSLEIKGILNTAVQQVLQIFQADRALVYRLFDNGTGSIIVDAIAEGCSDISGHPPPESLFPIADRPTSRTGWVYALDSLERGAISEHSRGILQRLGIRAMLVAPIVLQDVLWGWLVVHQCQGDRTWHSWETDLLAQLAGQLDLAISQAELYQQVQRLNADLERQIQARTAELRLASNFEATLKRITDKVRDSLDEDQILQSAVQELAVATEISCCNAALYDLEEGTSTIRYEYTTAVSPYQGRIAELAAFPEIYGPLLNGQSLQFCSLVPNPVRGRVAMLATPIMDDQGVLGDLWMINHAFYAFGEQDLRMAQQVANQCAIALRQARLFQASQAQVRELEKLNQLKDDFLSTVSHELRTPMSNIKMAIQMLELFLQQAGVLDDEPTRANRYFRILREESQREISLINDLLDLSRLDAGADALHLTDVNLSGWIVPLLRPFEERTRNHQQTLHIHLGSSSLGSAAPDVDAAASLPLLVTDLAKLERVLTELLNNACKYTPAGGEIRLELWSDAVERDGTESDSATLHPFTPTLQIRVTNTGAEIPPAERDRIFEKFYRIPNNDPWKYGGTGLGLALVKKLVACLQGKLEVECMNGQIQFTVELPLQPQSAPC
ncbi:MAG: hypothetical protein Fur0046_31750 [Cyanobacteria bacterium J069]|nr:MAG: GAF domain-containing protein [Cyanobacteria bacterium J069]